MGQLTKAEQRMGQLTRRHFRRDDDAERGDDGVDVAGVLAAGVEDQVFAEKKRNIRFLR
jgi:hypothetical protein